MPFPDFGCLQLGQNESKFNRDTHLFVRLISRLLTQSDNISSTLFCSQKVLCLQIHVKAAMLMQILVTCIPSKIINVSVSPRFLMHLMFSRPVPKVCEAWIFFGQLPQLHHIAFDGLKFNSFISLPIIPNDHYLPEVSNYLLHP